MATLESLSEDEAYLWVILQDHAGLDQAEFLWQAPENPDNCFRAWPFQVSWWRCEDPLAINQCARSVGKTLSIKVRMCAFPFLFPNQEAVLTAPELVHLEPIANLIETQIDRTRLLREMRRKDATHRPFMLEFVNGARIIGRIPQRDGRGIKGTHPLWLEMDEASDYPEPGWKEIIETLKRGHDGAMWRASGVTRGLRDSFYKNSKHGEDDPPLRYVTRRQEGNWTVHRIPAHARPTWTDEERQEKILQYGSKDDPDYRRNVIGSHGDSQSPLFVLHRLMHGVDDDPSTEFNTDLYWHFKIKDTELKGMNMEIADLIDPPSIHSRFKTTWAGADIGYTLDPTEILIFAEFPMTADSIREMKARDKSIPIEGASRMQCIGRVTLNRIAEPDQAAVIMALIDLYRPKVFAMDSTGAGLPLFQHLQRTMNDVAELERSERARRAAESIRGYNFSSKIVVEFDETIEVPEDATIEERIKLSGISRNVLEVSTDVLRTYVDEGRLWLPWDVELIDEMRGQTYSYSKSGIDQYGRKRIFSSGSFHALDAMRMAVLGHKQYQIENLIKRKPPETGPVTDIFMSPW